MTSISFLQLVLSLSLSILSLFYLFYLLLLRCVCLTVRVSFIVSLFVSFFLCLLLSPSHLWLYLPLSTRSAPFCIFQSPPSFSSISLPFSISLSLSVFPLSLFFVSLPHPLSNCNSFVLPYLSACNLLPSPSFYKRLILPNFMQYARTPNINILIIDYLCFNLFICCHLKTIYLLLKKVKSVRIRYGNRSQENCVT